MGLLKDADAFVAAHPGLRDINAGLMFRGPVPRGRGGGARGPFFGGDTVAIYIGQIWLATDVIDKNDIISITCWRARRDRTPDPQIRSLKGEALPKLPSYDKSLATD